MNSELFTPAFCYGAAIFAAFVTALSQIILKKQANITEARRSSFLRKFLNPRVIISYGLLFSTLVINQVALIISAPDRDTFKERAAYVRELLQVETETADGIKPLIWE